MKEEGAGGKCAEFLGVPQEEAGAEFAPALWTGEALPGGSPGGQVWRQRLWAAHTSGLASSARHSTVQLSPCAFLQLLAPMRSTAARRARPRPPVLALPHAGCESLFHFSFSDEDTCWHPPGRSVRWVARSQSPPFPPEGSGCAGGVS